MGVVRDIEIKVPFHKEAFTIQLKRFVDRKNSNCETNDIYELIENDEGYDIYLGRKSYDSFLFFLLRAVKTHYETDVIITFDADGDEEDETMIVKYTCGKFDVDILECDTYKLMRR